MKAVIKTLIGVVLVILIGFAAMRVDEAPGSLAAVETTLNERVSNAFGVSARAWAQFNIDGQKVTLTGEAPNEDARQALIERVASAEWGGGVLVGAVTVIDDSGLVVAPPPAVEEPAAVAEAEPEPEEIIVPPATLDEEEAAAAVEPESAAIESEALETLTCASRLNTVIEARRIGFASASADIDNPSRQQLREIAAIMAECPDTSLQITGHTDNSGNTSRNRQLSNRRAEAVRTFLTSVGAPADRLSASGVGSSQPLVSNETPAGREQNRRIEIEVVVIDE